ncbi:SGNH/GDSL hydrolase family protein [Pontibacter qinzhouensis]|uniref:SGNH/GDSL hydrolase family protein n=1 Tax=Pontibacter qinzhouensis TaxID=2603253 RepID=A0A5C8KE14_9BACT|nr:SGNH/GDSL hydrolase family protein [Pontibacter qinzhouensis]TXK52632.1 SGNH/GDSL hydrolase family protein [Pontibacter qinzhouensis]
MIRNSLYLLLLSILPLLSACKVASKSGGGQVSFIAADNPHIQYTGRIDFSDPKKPKFWSPGVYIQAKFQGTLCEIMLNEEELWGKNHNYLEIVIDDQEPFRIQTTGKQNTIRVAENLPEGEHTITICKNTESNIGYLEFLGFNTEKLLPLPPKPERKIEFIGNSITCGASSDMSQINCGQGEWHDQHNAYLAYGPRTARKLNAQWHLTAVSGIGLIHSCCDLEILMPQVHDKVSLRENKHLWDFSRYQPDVVTICLGQNDGVQDSTAFTTAYVTFIKRLRGHYPNAEIICLTSPMGDEKLTAALKNYLTGVVNYLQQQGDKKVHKFYFSGRYTGGCDAHPSMAEHELIANELTPFLKKTLHW